jgi:hypothetical protein
MSKFFRSKIVRIVLVVIGLPILFILVCYGIYQPPQQVIWGINYSADQAAYLDHDPEKLLQQIITDLQPKKIRLVAY